MGIDKYNRYCMFIIVIMMIDEINLFTVIEAICVLMAVWGLLMHDMAFFFGGLFLFFFNLFFIMPFMSKKLIIKKKGEQMIIERASDYWN